MRLRDIWRENGWESFQIDKSFQSTDSRGTMNLKPDKHKHSEATSQLACWKNKTNKRKSNHLEKLRLPSKSYN